MTFGPQAGHGGRGRALSRRQVLELGAIGAVAVGGSYAGVQLLGPRSPALVGPGSAAVATAEAARTTTGKVVERTLTAAPVTVDLGGRTVSTWAYDGSVPGPEIRLSAGDQLKVRLVNELPEATTVHWHGLALRNDMDGVPDLTMPTVESGATFDYAFVVPDPAPTGFIPTRASSSTTGSRPRSSSRTPTSRVTTTRRSS